MPDVWMWIFPLYLHINKKSDDDDDKGITRVLSGGEEGWRVGKQILLSSKGEGDRGWRMFENKERSGAKMGWVWGCQELVNFLVPCLSYLKVWGGGGGCE